MFFLIYFQSWKPNYYIFKWLYLFSHTFWSLTLNYGSNIWGAHFMVSLIPNFLLILNHEPMNLKNFRPVLLCEYFFLGENSWQPFGLVWNKKKIPGTYRGTNEKTNLGWRLIPIWRVGPVRLLAPLEDLRMVPWLNQLKSGRTG